MEGMEQLQASSDLLLSWAETHHVLYSQVRLSGMPRGAEQLSCAVARTGVRVLLVWESCVPDMMEMTQEMGRARVTAAKGPFLHAAAADSHQR